MALKAQSLMESMSAGYMQRSEHELFASLQYRCLHQKWSNREFGIHEAIEQ